MSSEIIRPIAHIDRNAWYLRFYLWLWNADVNHVDFCRLFWGYIFAIPCLVVRGIYTPFKYFGKACVEVSKTIWPVLKFCVRKVGTGVERFFNKLIDGIIAFCHWFAEAFPSKAEYPEALITEPPKKKSKNLRKSTSTISTSTPKPPSPTRVKFQTWKKEAGENFLTKAAATADKGVVVAQTMWPVTRIILMGIGGIFLLAMAAGTGLLLYVLASSLGVVAEAFVTVLMAILGAIGWFFTGGAFVLSAVWNWPYLWMIPAVIVSAMAIAGAIMLLIKGLFSNPVRKSGRAVGRAAGTTTRAVAKPVGDGALSFTEAMATGVKSIKYRTCPIIKVK